MFSRLGEENDVQSSIPSHMKYIYTLDVKIDGSMKVKRCTLVITNCETSLNSKGKVEEGKQASSDHIIVQEADDLEAKMELTIALEKPVNEKGLSQ